MEEIKPVPESISHKNLSSLMVKAKKELNVVQAANDKTYCSSEKDDFETLLLSWKSISKEVINKLKNHGDKFVDNRTPKSLMALGAMEAHINMAIQALKASETDK